MNLRNGFTLGDWTVFPLEGRMESGESSRRVQPKSMDVLMCLAEAPGVVLQREDLLRRVWGERAVSDDPLTRCIGELRRALGDTRGDPEYILTVPKRGYRLLKAVTPLTVAIEDDPLVEPETGAIAVLPFADMTAAQDQAYFGDGLAEELINLLAQNPALRVAARTSSFSFRDSTVPITEIARQLGVRHVVEGSVRRSGERVRITAQLIAADDGFHLWSQSFDTTFDDVFEIQDEISARVAETLEVRVLNNPPESRRTDPRAYTLYLEARHDAREGSRESMEHAIRCLEEALSIDPEYAPGWAELATLHNNLAGQGHHNWDEGFNRGREAARRAVEVDPAHFGGHLQLAWIAHRYEGDLAGAVAHMQKALDLNGTNFGLLRSAAVLLLQLGRVDKAIDVLEYCAKRSPTDPRGGFNLGVAYKYGDRLEDAEQVFLNVQRLSSVYAGTIAQLGEVTLLRARPAESLGYFERLDGFRRAKGVAVAQHAMGRSEASEAALAELIDGWADEQQMAIAEVYAYRGEPDAAFEWLEKDYARFGPGGWGEVRLQRWYDALRGDARWQELLERTGVSDEVLSRYDLRIDAIGG